MGLVCDVRLQRSRYTMVVSSAVEVDNAIDAVVEIEVPKPAASRTAGGVDVQGALSDRIVLPPCAGQAQPLPLGMTAAGSADTCWSMRLRPGAGNTERPQGDWGLVQQLPDAPGCAVVTSELSDANSKRWYCRVLVAPPPVGGAQHDSPAAMGFPVPLKEAVLQSWRCVVGLRESLPVRPGWLYAPGRLYATCGFLCLQRDSGSGK